MTNSNQITPSQQAAFNKFLDENKATSFEFKLIGGGASTMPIIDKNNIVHPTPMYSSKSKHGETTFASTEGVTVNYVYSKSQKTVIHNGMPVREDVPESIWFEANKQCRVSVPRNDHALLIRLLFSNECANGINPAKVEPLTGYAYELIQPAKTAAERDATRSMILRVQVAVDQALPEERTLMAQRINGQGRHTIRMEDGGAHIMTDLLDLAASHPDVVLAATSDQTIKTRATVEQAVGNKLLSFQHDTREWKYNTGQVLLSVPSGDYTNVLVDWLSDVQGASALRSLKKSLEGQPKAKVARDKSADEPVPEGYKRGPFGRLVPIEQPEETEA